jgi:uncharacterized phiE125 gp8 family phage protein
MALSLVTPPAVEPVTLAEAKLQMRLGLTDDDALITELIVAAREYVETFTHRALIAQTWDDKREGFPGYGGQAIWLPKPPLLLTPTAPVITYVDPNGVTQTWSSSLYTVDAPTGPKARAACVVPNYGEYFPLTRAVVNAVTIRFTAGYGALATTVPSSLKAATKLLVETWLVGGSGAPIPPAVDALLWPFKAF